MNLDELEYKQMTEREQAVIAGLTSRMQPREPEGGSMKPRIRKVSWPMTCRDGIRPLWKCSLPLGYVGWGDSPAAAYRAWRHVYGGVDR